MKEYQIVTKFRVGRITKITGKNAPFLVDYDDGDCEEMSFRVWNKAALDVLAGNPFGYHTVDSHGFDDYVPKDQFEATYRQI
jgi:hypothetical protein